MFYPSACSTPFSFPHLLQLGDACLILPTHRLNPSVHTFWLPDSLQRPPLSPSHPTPYSHSEATLTIPITFCLLLSNISGFFPSEELLASQPALLISLLWPQLTFFPSSQFLILILRKLPRFMLISLVALCSSHLYVSLPWPTHFPCTSLCSVPWKSHSFAVVCSKNCFSLDLCYPILPLWSFPLPAMSFLISSHLLFPLFSSHQIENIPSNLSPLSPSLSFFSSINWL